MNGHISIGAVIRSRGHDISIASGVFCRQTCVPPIGADGRKNKPECYLTRIETCRTAMAKQSVLKERLLSTAMAVMGITAGISCRSINVFYAKSLQQRCSPYVTCRPYEMILTYKMGNCALKVARAVRDSPLLVVMQRWRKSARHVYHMSNSGCRR